MGFATKWDWPSLAGKGKGQGWAGRVHLKRTQLEKIWGQDRAGKKGSGPETRANYLGTPKKEVFVGDLVPHSSLAGFSYCVGPGDRGISGVEDGGACLG